MLRLGAKKTGGGWECLRGGWGMDEFGVWLELTSPAHGGEWMCLFVRSFEIILN